LGKPSILLALGGARIEGSDWEGGKMLHSRGLAAGKLVKLRGRASLGNAIRLAEESGEWRGIPCPELSQACLV